MDTKLTVVSLFDLKDNPKALKSGFMVWYILLFGFHARVGCFVP